MIKNLLRLLTALAVFLVFSSYGQIIINAGVSPEDMVDNIVGDGVTYMNVEFTGADISRGIFSNGGTTNIGINSGIFLTSGAGYLIPGPNTSTSDGVNNGMPGDPQLTVLAGMSTYDASVLEFDFIPESDTLRFRYVFGSEEYPEWVLNLYNDVFGYFVTGPNPAGGLYVNKNIALVPGTQLPVSIANINNVIPSYPQYYVDNTGGLTIEYDGFTTVLTAFVLVVPCEQYHIKMAVGDAGDGIYDTGVFIEENSFISPRIEVNMELEPEGTAASMVEGCVEADIIFKLPAAGWAPYTVNFEILGTAINGTDYMPIPTTVYIPEGTDTASIHIEPIYDGIIEGEETIIFVIENTLGCETQWDTATVIIIDYVDMVTANSGNIMICQGQTVDLWVAAINGIPPYTYTWDQSPINNDTISVSPPATTTYHCTITDMCGHTVTDSVKVIVNPAPQAFLGPDTTLCFNDTLVLHAGAGFLSYLWQNGSQDSTYMVTSPGWYWVQVTSAGGCSSIDSINVDMFPPITMDIGQDTVLCYGASIVFDAGPGYQSYLWQDGSTGQTLTADTTGLYWVKVINDDGCEGYDEVNVTMDLPPYADLGQDASICEGDQMVLSPGTGFLSYEWQNGSTSPTFTVTDEGLYWVIVTNSCGSDIDSINITLFPSPQVNLGNDTALCKYETPSLLLDAGSGYISYTWQDGSSGQYFSVTQTGLYSVEVENFYGCQGEDQVSIVIADPQVYLGDDTFFCEGQTITLNAGSGFSLYQWHDGSNNQDFTTDQPGTFWVQVTDQYSCYDRDTILIDKYQIPYAEIGSQADLCEGDTLMLTALDGEFQYLWNGIQGTNTLTVSEGGQYVLEMKNACGSDFDTINVAIYPLPYVSLGEDLILFPGEILQIDAGSGFVSYIWHDGSGSRYFEANAEGTFYVEVFDGHCKSSDTIMIEEFEVVVPNVFTPNYDGKNDEFYPDAKGLTDFELVVFNRWGEKVFESEALNDKWDGKSNGTECSEGVYFWVLSCHFGSRNISKTYKGSVNLIR